MTRTTKRGVLENTTSLLDISTTLLKLLYLCKTNQNTAVNIIRWSTSSFGPSIACVVVSLIFLLLALLDACEHLSLSNLVIGHCFCSNCGRYAEQQFVSYYYVSILVECSWYMSLTHPCACDRVDRVGDRCWGCSAYYCYVTPASGFAFFQNPAQVFSSAIRRRRIRETFFRKDGPDYTARRAKFLYYICNHVLCWVSGIYSFSVFFRGIFSQYSLSVLCH